MGTAHHYLMHLLKSKISESNSRVVFVSSGAVRMVPDEYIRKSILSDGRHPEPRTLTTFPFHL
jgi:hypothetical protein